MFYLPIIDTTFPSWLPFVGGEPFRFFNAIFNIADISITFGVFILIVSVVFSPKKNQPINSNEDEFQQQEIETKEIIDNITQ